jgi:antitoxin VapB
VVIVDSSALLAVIANAVDKPCHTNSGVALRARHATPLGSSDQGRRDFRRPGAYFYQDYRNLYQGSTMGAQLNIKSEDAYRLASRLSELTGKSLTSVVTKALRAELEREEHARDREERLRRVREITADIRRHLQHPLPSSDHDWLYDENGLPR